MESRDGALDFFLPEFIVQAASEYAPAVVDRWDVQPLPACPILEHVVTNTLAVAILLQNKITSLYVLGQFTEEELTDKVKASVAQSNIPESNWKAALHSVLQGRHLVAVSAQVGAESQLAILQAAADRLPPPQLLEIKTAHETLIQVQLRVDQAKLRQRANTAQVTTSSKLSLLKDREDAVRDDVLRQLKMFLVFGGMSDENNAIIDRLPEERREQYKILFFKKK